MLVFRCVKIDQFDIKSHIFTQRKTNITITQPTVFRKQVISSVRTITRVCGREVINKFSSHTGSVDATVNLGTAISVALNLFYFIIILLLSLLLLLLL